MRASHSRASRSSSYAGDLLQTCPALLWVVFGLVHCSHFILLNVIVFTFQCAVNAGLIKSFHRACS